MSSAIVEKSVKDRRLLTPGNREKKVSDTNVLHSPRLERKVILLSVPCTCSLRLAVTSSKTLFNLAPLYFVLVIKPKRSWVKKRGFPKISPPRCPYSCKQSGTVIRNLPNMI